LILKKNDLFATIPSLNQKPKGGVAE